MYNRNKFIGTVHLKVFSAISLVAIAGIVLAIYGGTESADSPTLDTNVLLKVSVILFVACYVAFVFLFLIFLRHLRDLPSGEQKLLLCFACCAPFMVVRYLYSILGTFVESLRGEFSVLTGSVTIFLCMAVIEEIIVVALFVLAGLSLERLPPALRTGVKSRDSAQVPLQP